MKTIMKPLLLCLIILLVGLSSSSHAGGEIPGAFLAFPGDVASIDWNPAILGVSPYMFQAVLNPMNMNLWTNAWTPNDLLLRINDYWDEEDKEEILDAIVGEAFLTGLDLRSGLYLGADDWAFRTGLLGSVQLGLDKDIFRLILYGTGRELEDLALEMEETQASGSLLLNTGFGMAYPLTQVAQELNWTSFHVGASLHYLTGLAYLSVDTAGNFLVDEDFNLVADGRMEALYSVMGLDGGGGHGAAIGLGVWGEPAPDMGVGFSITNLGVVRWSGLHKLLYEGEFTFDHPMHEVPEEENGEEGEEEGIDAEIELVEEPLFWPTPVSAQAGMYYFINPQVQLAGSLGYSQDPLDHFNLSVATRFFYPIWMPVTLALDYASYKGMPSLSTSFGLRFGPWETFTVTISDIKLVAGVGKEVTVGLQTGFRF